jgi:hypothetical protein
MLGLGVNEFSTLGDMTQVSSGPTAPGLTYVLIERVSGLTKALAGVNREAHPSSVGNREFVWRLPVNEE